jgi:hypothetical protein
VCYQVATTNYLDLLHLALVSREFHYYIADDYLWFIAFRSVYASTRLLYRHLPPGYWRRLFIRYTQLRLRWHTKHLRGTAGWKPKFELDNIPYSSDDTLIYSFMDVQSIDHKQRKIAFGIVDSQSNCTAVTLDVVTNHAESVAVCGKAPFQPDNINLDTGVMIGYDRKEGMCTGVWFQAHGNMHQVSLSALSDGRVTHIIRPGCVYVDGSYRVLGLDAYTHRLVMTTFSLVDGLVPQKVRVVWIGNGALTSYSSFIGCGLGYLVILVPQESKVPEMWCTLLVKPVMYLDGVEDLKELQTRYMFAVDPLRQSPHEVWRGEPLHIVLDTAASTYVWEFVLYQPLQPTKPIRVIHKQLACSMLDVYSGLLVYTDNVSYTRIMDLSGAGDILMDSAHKKWRVERRRENQSPVLCEFDAPFIRSFVTSNQNYLYVVGGDQIEELNLEAT